MNLFDILERGAKLCPTKAAVYFQDKDFCESISYGFLCHLAGKFSGGLTRLGVQRGERIAVFLPNMLDYPIVTYGALRIGAVPVLLSSNLKSEELGRYIERSGAKVLVTCGELFNEAVKALGAMNLEKIVVIGDFPPTRDLKNFGEMLQSDIPPKCELQPNDPAFILFTSGTTNESKGAILSHGNIISNINSVNHYTGMRSDDKMMCFLPLFHCFGQNFVMNATFNATGTLVLHKRFVLDKILESLVRNKVTMFFSIPTNYKALLKLSDIKPFAAVRYFFTAADKMPSEVVRAWLDKHRKLIYEGYGLTETSPCATYNHETEYIYDSVGTAIENVEIGIVDENRNRLGSNEIGEIIVRGPNVFQGYLNEPEATRNALRNGWFFTGDIGRIDKEGYLYYIDRKNDSYKVSGFFVCPGDIEKCISKHFGNRIQDVGVIGVPDEEKGKISLAFVVTADPALTESEICKVVENKLAGYQRLKGVRFVEQIPKTPTGKILKKELRKSEAL